MGPCATPPGRAPGDLASFLGFLHVEFVRDLAIHEIVAQLAVVDAFVAGDLLHAHVFVDVFEVVLLDPAVEDEPDDFLGGALQIVGEDGDLRDFALGVGGPHDELAHRGVVGPWLVDDAELIEPHVARVIARALDPEAGGGTRFIRTLCPQRQLCRSRRHESAGRGQPVDLPPFQGIQLARLIGSFEVEH